MGKYYFLFGLLAVCLFYKFGRSLYLPLVNNLRGKVTIETWTTSLKNHIEERLRPRLKELQLERFPDNLRILGFKKEQRLEVYTRIEEKLILIKSYPFTASSGILGPKLREGDRQIPEGVYKLEYLNPNSTFHLSMKINYPNEFDQQKGKAEGRMYLGNDIFIHGKASTVGCIPIGDKAIEELFFLVSKVKVNEVSVIISPWDFRKNPNEPEIEKITWEQELYKTIKAALTIEEY